jgi:hypothetical protein
MRTSPQGELCNSRSGKQIVDVLSDFSWLFGERVIVEFPKNSWRSRACVIVHARSDQDEFEVGKREVDRTSRSTELYGGISP